jgi:hypothetical protein
MTTYRFAVEVEIDDELLASHDGSLTPPPNNPREWYGGDLVAAINDGLAEVVHDELEVLSVTAGES